MSRLVFDSGGLTGLVSNRGIRALVDELVRRGYDPLVPAVILSEVVTGTARDASLNRILRPLGTEAAGEVVARTAGRLRARARPRGRRVPSGIDALVAAHAVTTAEHAIVLTSDPDDLRHLLADHGSIVVEGV